MHADPGADAVQVVEVAILLFNILRGQMGAAMAGRPTRTFFSGRRGRRWAPGKCGLRRPGHRVSALPASETASCAAGQLRAGQHCRREHRGENSRRPSRCR